MDGILTATVIHADGVTWAYRIYPHPSGGMIDVAWHLEDGQRSFDAIRALEGGKALMS